MTEAGQTFSLRRSYPAPPATVYAFFTDPTRMARWFCPNPDLLTTCELDVTVGGAWRCAMGSYVVGGRYLEVEPDRRLVFTWAWASDPEVATTVTVTLSPDGAGTLVVLDHSEDGPGDEGHQTGWELTLGRLAEVL